MRKRQPSFIETNLVDLQRQQEAMIAEKVMSCLSSKGFTFDTEHDMKLFFKNRIKGTVSEDGTTTLSLDGTDICAYKSKRMKPVTKRKNDQQDIAISFEFIEL